MLLLCALVLPAACATPPAAPVVAAGLSGRLLPYGLRSMAFDGQNTLWQIALETSERSGTSPERYLISQNLSGQLNARIRLQQSLPEHRSLAWGRNRVWMLDYDNTLYALTSDGSLSKRLKLTALPEPRAAEQILWSGDELWLLHGAWLSPEGRTEPARFYRLDPDSGAILATLMPAEKAQPGGSTGFSDFIHQNLGADAEAFYVARSSIFDKALNAIFRIDRRSGAVSRSELGRIYTGLGSLFLQQGQIYGIELLDTSNCGERCRGRIESLPNPATAPSPAPSSVPSPRPGP